MYGPLQQESAVTIATNSMRIQDHEEATSHRIHLLLSSFVSAAHRQIT
jgi:hypothetical protein